MSRKDEGQAVVKQTFGGALYQQGRGFYSALELFAILRGAVLLEKEEQRLGAVMNTRLLPDEGTVQYLRPGHDHARRLLVADHDVVEGVFSSDETREAVRGLLRGLEAAVPGRRRTPDKWQLRHLFPYPAEAIHYDAVERRGKVNVERYQFRGAGALAHKILRTDPDAGRRNEVRGAFRALLSDSKSAVGALLDALTMGDQVVVRDYNDKQSLSVATFSDGVEAESLAGLEESPTRWMELLREGVHRILTRRELSSFDRVEGLMHWVPFCVALHQLSMARRAVERDEDQPMVFDAGHSKSTVRTLSRADLGAATATVKESLLASAVRMGFSDLTRGPTAWWKGPRTFFTTTLFAVGALNAHTGLRHLEVRPRLLQCIVHALVGAPISLERFGRDILGERLRIVADLKSASAFDELELDNRALKTNGQHLSARLDEVGLLRAYSDSTLMVGIHE